MTETPTIDEAELARKLGNQIRDAYRALVVFGKNVQSPIRAGLREIRLKSLIAVHSEDEHLRGRGAFWLSVLANVGKVANEEAKVQVRWPVFLRRCDLERYQRDCNTICRTHDR